MKKELVEAAKRMRIRDVLLESASKIGTMRYLSRARMWHLRFNEMTIRFLDHGVIDIDLDRQIEALRQRTVNQTMPILDIVKQEIARAIALHPRPISRTSGGDICEVIAKGAHDVFGRTHVALGRVRAAVEEVFRAAYTFENFRTTKLYSDIRAWEQRRAPLRVFAAPQAI